MKYLLIILLFLAGGVQAQDLQSLDTLRVSAMNIPLKIAETGRSITVLDEKAIQAIPANSIDEILQFVTGIEIQSRGGFGVQSDILMRGSTFTQVLILINGMKINDPLTGHFNGNLPVSKADISRIEVLRGPGASIYGPDAVGGVINIVTKAFERVPLEGEYSPGGLSGSYTLGSNKLSDARLGFHMRGDRFVFSGGLEARESDGETIEAVVIDSNTTLEAYNTWFDIKTANASLAFLLTENWQISARSSLDHRDFNARYFYTTSPFDKANETVDNYFNQIRIARMTDWSTTDFHFAHKYSTDVFEFSPDFPSTNRHVTRFANFFANHHQIINRFFEYKAGVQVDHRSIESNDRGNHEDMHYGVYGLIRHMPKQWNMILNLRADYEENYGFQFLPSLNISYRLPKAVLRASGGKSIRTADYTERFVSNNLQDLTPGRSLGNPALDAETAWSAELGADLIPGKNWRIGGTAFARWSDQLIDYIQTNQIEIGSVSETGSLLEGADYFFAQNIADVQTLGFEVESRLGIPFHPDGRFDWTIGYTFLDNSNEDDVLSVYLTNSARHLLSNRFSLQLGGLRLSLSSVYKQREGRIASAINTEMQDSYTLWNGELRMRLTRGLSLTGSGFNLFDIEYQNILGARMPGRWWKGGVAWDF